MLCRYMRVVLGVLGLKRDNKYCFMNNSVVLFIKHLIRCVHQITVIIIYLKISPYFAIGTIVQEIFYWTMTVWLSHSDPNPALRPIAKGACALYLRNSIISFGCAYQGPGPLLYALQAWRRDTLGGMPSRMGSSCAKPSIMSTAYDKSSWVSWSHSFGG